MLINYSDKTLNKKETDLKFNNKKERNLNGTAL